MVTCGSLLPCDLLWVNTSESRTVRFYIVGMDESRISMGTSHQITLNILEPLSLYDPYLNPPP